MKSAKKSLWPLALALFMGLVYAAPADALRVNFSSKGDSSVLTFSFDSSIIPKYSVKRVGSKELAITLPAAIWDTETKPGTKDMPGKLVQSISTAGNVVQIKTRTNAFGFISIPSPGKAQFLLQLYRDPIGARWKPPSAKPVAKLAVKTIPKPVAEPTFQPLVQSVAQPAPRKITSAPVKQSVPVPQVAEPVSVAGTGQDGADLPPETLPTKHKPFFSVPYSVRNEVTPPGGDINSATQSPSPFEAGTGKYPPASELRFKAQNKMAEEVKFAELAGSESGRAPIVGLVDPNKSQVVGGAVSGVVEGAVEPLESSGQGSAGGAVAPPPGAVQDQPVAVVPIEKPDGAVSGSVAPPPGQPVAVAPIEQPTGAVSGSVTPPGEPISVSPPSAEVAGSGQVGGAVAPPPSVVQGAPPPDLVAGEVAQVVEPKPDTLASETLEPEQSVEPALELVEVDPNAEDGAQSAELAVDNATASAAAKEEELRNRLYEGQSMMFNGNLQEALTIFEGLLKEPKLPADSREDTLYAVADIKKQLFGDDLAGNFEDISQSYIEAMNSNLRSNKVPSALLNLGLVNLQVGNFPEAKAYFKLLQEKYPDDDNIPSISYYWGEFYYKKGDYKKAADQFQYLIQTYPEHQLVKQAAFYLADSLNKTGFVEQAFQIVDYIDKRWPDYYMENMQFLRLAGSVEMQLKKWPEAKNHYFTYYNLNPEADGADIVLARIGDLYIRLGENKAAKQIYEKAVKDYPAEEGGLVAKMRLAEEGIYDDPSMPEMVSVFDRPYNKKPENIYKEIATEYPDSPLAPIAQLKLAMWYAFHKKYPESLAASQDLIEKFPDSPLVDKAKTLGDSVFALAVPGMAAEGRYGRVVRYWETYDFIGKEDSKVDDQTMLNIATSYWKIGQPEKALEIIQPFLKKKQIDNISDEALGLAVNIYLDQLAWKKIADLVEMTKANWKIKPAQQRQLDYARAMSVQNMGDPRKALPMWAEIGKDLNNDPAFRAYAMYYMSKDAMQRQDLRRVFVYAQEALALLLQTRGDPEKIKDTVLMSIYATERSGRYNEALKWAKEYDQYIDVDNPEWASTRFKLARIYRKAGAINEWKQLLSDIMEKKPETLQAQLAKSALETFALEQQAQQYAPGPQ